MEYEAFLGERRRRMAEIIRVAFRTLGGEAAAQPLTPPWFLPGAEVVWQRIVETERALRGVVREVYAAKFGETAAQRIERALPESQHESLERALRARPAAAEPLSIVDYLYLGQLPPLLFEADIWQDARHRFGGTRDAKERLQSAVGQITPVRNEIAHVREVAQDRLLRASLACGDVLEMLRGSSSRLGACVKNDPCFHGSKKSVPPRRADQGIGRESGVHCGPSGARRRRC